MLQLLLFDTFLWTLLGWYLEKVVPKEFGVVQPFYFPFTRTFWLGEVGRAEEPAAAGHGATAIPQSTPSPAGAARPQFLSNSRPQLLTNS